jgi:hypothetical protein
MTALLSILERQADAVHDHLPGEIADRIADQVGAPFTDDELTAELGEQAAACRALAEVALDQGVAPRPFDLSQLVLEALSLLHGTTVDQTLSAMVEDVVVVHAGGGPAARLDRCDRWMVLFGTMASIAGLATLLATHCGGRASRYVRLAFDAPEPEPGAAPPARSRVRSSSHPAGSAAPADAVSAVERWAASAAARHDPDQVDPHDVRLSVHKRGKSLTIVESWRVVGRRPHEPEWHDVRVAQLRWVPDADGFSLHYTDASDRWHRYERVATADVLTLLDLIDLDPDRVFWP